MDMALILLCCFFVLVTEALNTCVEKICDYIQPEFDLRIGIIKDLAGGAECWRRSVPSALAFWCIGLIWVGELESFRVFMLIT